MLDLVLNASLKRLKCSRWSQDRANHRDLYNARRFLFRVLKKLKRSAFNPFLPNEPFLYPLKTSENLILMVFWYFQGAEKECIRNKWVKSLLPMVCEIGQWKTARESLEQFTNYPSVFTCSKLTVETLEQGVEYVQS